MIYQILIGIIALIVVVGFLVPYLISFHLRR